MAEIEIWVTNFKKGTKRCDGPGYYVGDPAATSRYSREELIEMGFAGVYRKAIYPQRKKNG